MMRSRFNLHFIDYDEPELLETSFDNSVLGESFQTIRGRNTVGHSGTFKWTRAVQATALLFTKTTYNLRDTNLGTLTGHRGSLASSLDCSINKHPQWLVDMFGGDAHGRSYVLRIVNRINSSMKRKGPVSLSINTSFLAVSDIHIYCDNSLITPNDNQFVCNLIASINQTQKIEENNNILLVDSPVRISSVA